MSSPPWLDLPDYLTEKILERLPLSDYLRFAAVCRRWRSIQADHRRRHAPSPPPMLKLPWFIPQERPQEEEEEEETQSWCCYSPFEGRTYRIKIPSYELTVPNCGWLLRPDAVFNPISGLEIRFPEPLDGDDVEVVAVSPSPHPVVFIIKYDGELLVFRPGDRHWTQLHLPMVTEDDGYDILGVAVGRKLYCVCSTDEEPNPDHLLIVDASPTQPTVCSYRMLEGPEQIRMSGFSWLVESDGVMLMVHKAAHGFRVFRADASRRMWTRVGSLGDRLLILHSTSCSVSLLAADVGLRKNCIYYSMRLGNSFKWQVFDLDFGTVREAFLPNGSLVKLDGEKLFFPCVC